MSNLKKKLMSNLSKYDSAFKAFQQRYKNEIGAIGKILGNGAFGEVRDRLGLSNLEFF